jgi:predicted PurR-regulated permease PerM
MESKKYHIYFLFILIIAVSILLFFIFQPFLTAILTAAILAVVFRKPYGFFLRISRHHKDIASLLTCILIAVTIIIPASFTLGLMAREANQIYKNVTAENSMYNEQIDKIMVYIRDLPFVQSFDMDQILAQEGILNALKNLSQWLIVLVRKTYKNVVGLVLGIFIMFFSLFYFFIEGEKLVKKILYLSPLKSSQESLLMNKFVSISRATIKGALTVAVIQGLIGGLTFFITGVPATAIWTMLMIILSMIPLLGSGFVWFPVGV